MANVELLESLKRMLSAILLLAASVGRPFWNIFKASGGQREALGDSQTDAVSDRLVGSTRWLASLDHLEAL